jgi:hypothetical protein
VSKNILPCKFAMYDFVREYFATVDGFVTKYFNDVWIIYFGISFSAHAHAHMFTK